MMPHAFSILFGAVFTVAVCLALGRMLLRRLGVELHRQEEHPLAFVTGAALWSLVIFFLSVLGLVYDAVFLLAGVAVLAAAFWTGAHKPRGDSLPPLPQPWRWVWIGALLLFGVLYLANAMAPEMSPDGSTYHLGLVGRYYRNHGFERITTHMYANLSQGIEMLFLFAYAFGRHSAAAMIHLAFLLALVWSMVNYSRRFGFAGAGAAGALLVFLCPLVGRDGTSAYNDVAIAALLFALFHLIEVWAERRSPGLFIPIGLVAGFCYASKYTAFLAVPYAVVVLAWRLIRERKPFVKPLAIVSACVVLMAAPWAIKNWVWLDNPVSPFFNTVFPNPHVHPTFEAGYRQNMRNYAGLKSHWDIPLEVTVRGEALAGMLGAVFLLAPLALLSLRERHGRKLLVAALVFGATYATNVGTRFLIPPLPFVSLAMALVLVRYRGVAMTVVLVHAVLSWPDILKIYCRPYAWRLDRIEWKAALRVEPEEHWLERKLATYPVARMMDEIVPPGEKVLTFGQIPEAYTDREILVVYQSAFNEALGDMLWTPLMADSQPTRRFRFDFPPAEYRKFRVIQTATHESETWGVTEMRILDGDAELERTPGWRLRAYPNPWDVQRAFDNSPVTRWRTWRTLFDGMFIEADLGQAEPVSAVVLDCSDDQWGIRLRLEAMDADGNWTRISAEPVETRVEPPAGLRRAAALEIAASGVRFLLIHEREFGRDDYFERQQEWGITMLREYGGKRLYRID